MVLKKEKEWKNDISYAIDWVSLRRIWTVDMKFQNWQLLPNSCVSPEKGCKSDPIRMAAFKIGRSVEIFFFFTCTYAIHAIIIQ